MTDLVLSASQLNVAYGPIRAVRGVDFEVRAGEIVTLIGANGAGKSSILRAVSGLLPYSGELQYHGQSLRGCAPEKRVRMGIVQVPEGRGIFGNLTVLENLILASWTQRGNKVVHAHLERVYDLFPRLRERARQSAGTLSGGEQQMLALGRALMADARLLLLDEPSMGLAPVLVREIFKLIIEINRSGTTILLVEQNAHMALRVAHRAYLLQTGAVVLSDAADRLMQHPSMKAAYFGG